MSAERLRAGLDGARRRGDSWLDQAAARTWRRLRGSGDAPAFDGEPRFALLSVNYSTTRWLKLMLRSLVDLEGLERLVRVVICDNGSRDGGVDFLRALATASARMMLVENCWWTHHARGMRLAIRALQAAERDQPENSRCNVLLFVDPDVQFLRADTLTALAERFVGGETAFAGELRRHVLPLPEAQASFLAVRRDWAERRDISPWLHGGSPAWPLQRDIWRAGGRGEDFPVYREGYAMHRGRAGVAAAQAFYTGSAYASVANRAPHFMGVPQGQERWQMAEARYTEWLGTEAEPQLLELLSRRLA